MKKLNILLMTLAMSTLVLTSCKDDDGPRVELPAAVEAYITTTYPSAEIEESEQETLCTGEEVYEVELELADDTELDLTFSATGELLFSEGDINSSDLPEAVTQSIANNYPDYSIDEAEIITMADATTRYEVELESSAAEIEVLFDDSGEVICEQPDEDE